MQTEVLDCPHCPNQGWWADQQSNYWTGDAEWVQVQCEWCWTTPNSRFNMKGITMDDLMIVERFSKGNWEEIKFDELRHGDKFRMFTPDGDQHIDTVNNYGTEEKPIIGTVGWIVDGDVYMNKEGILTVNCLHGPQLEDEPYIIWVEDINERAEIE